MKNYIIFTADIHPIGGMQNYVAGKAKYLEDNDWKVNVFFNGKNTGSCAITSMDKYVEGGLIELTFPPQYCPPNIRNRILEKMVTQIGSIDGETIIESQASSHALWAELLAKKIGAKHFCFICNELFRGKGKYYEEYIDFFDFKHRRREIAGIKEVSMSLLFEGYKRISPTENYVFVAANEGAVQDVENIKVNAIELADWNIAYIGRIEKGYVNKIVEGVKELSLSYPKKNIQFIFVGNVGLKRNMIETTFSNTNVKCVFLGDCIPIPRALFSKIDVAVAGSGSALCSAYENIKTILADAGNYRANGVLGIDTFDILYHEEDLKQMSFKEALEKVLNSSYYDKKLINLPKRLSANNYYEQHFEIIKKSDSKAEYYHFSFPLVPINKYLRVYKFIVHMKCMNFLARSK